MSNSALNSGPSTSPVLLTVALFAIGVAWGSTMPLTKIAVSTGHQPLGLIVWQMLTGAIALGVISALRRRWPKPTPSVFRHFLIIALLGTIVPNSFSYMAAAQLPAGIMSIAIATIPMFALAIAIIIRLERFVLHRLAGVLLGAVAVILLVGPETSLPDPTKAVFVLVALVAPFCYGLEGNYIAKFAPRAVDPIGTLFGASVLGVVIAVPLAVATGSWVDLRLPWGPPEKALIISSLFHVVAYTGYVWLVSVAGSVFSSQISYIVTLAGVVLSMAFLGESYSGWVWVALALMIGGLALVRPHRPPEEASPAVFPG